LKNKGLQSRALAYFMSLKRGIYHSPQVFLDKKG